MVSYPMIVDEKVQCIQKESSFLSNDETLKWNRNEKKDSSDRVESISSDADDVASIWFHPTMSRTNRFSLCSSSLINRCDRLNSFVFTHSESSSNWILRDQQSTVWSSSTECWTFSISLFPTEIQSMLFSDQSFQCDEHSPRTNSQFELTWEDEQSLLYRKVTNKDQRDFLSEHISYDCLRPSSCFVTGCPMKLDFRKSNTPMISRRTMSIDC